MFWIGKYLKGISLAAIVPMDVTLSMQTYQLSIFLDNVGWVESNWGIHSPFRYSIW